jgi:hypothetical protein
VKSASGQRWMEGKDPSEAPPKGGMLAATVRYTDALAERPGPPSPVLCHARGRARVGSNGVRFALSDLQTKDSSLSRSNRCPPTLLKDERGPQLRDITGQP